MFLIYKLGFVKFFLLTATRYSDMICSVTLLKFIKTDIFLRCLLSRGGNTFGTGVTVSSFQRFAYTEVLIMCARGGTISKANILMTFAGKQARGPICPKCKLPK